MDLWALVSLDQRLNGSVHGSFAVVLYLRLMGYSRVIVSINTVSR